MKIKAGETRYLVRKIETEKSYDNVRFRLTNKKNTIEKSTDAEAVKDKVIVQDGVFLIPLQQKDTADLVGSVTIEAEIDYQDKSVRYTDYNAVYVNESLGWEQITGSKPSDDDGIEPVMEAIEQGIYVIVGPESSQELINAVTELFQDTKQIAQSVRDDADAGEFDGEDGYSPQVTVKTETPSTYVLHIKDADHEFDTPNLQGQGGEGTIEAGDGLKRTENEMSVDLQDSTDNVLDFTNNKLRLSKYNLGHDSEFRQFLADGYYLYPLASKSYVDTIALGLGDTLGVSIDSQTFVMTLQLKHGNEVLSTDTVDLPLESVVVSGSYDAQTKEVVLTLESGSTIRFSVADLVSGLVSTDQLATEMTARTQQNITLENGVKTDAINCQNISYITYTNKDLESGEKLYLIPIVNNEELEYIDITSKTYDYVFEYDSIKFLVESSDTRHFTLTTENEVIRQRQYSREIGVLQRGVSSLQNGKQDKIDNDNKLNADLLADGSNNKPSQWNNKSRFFKGVLAQDGTLSNLASDYTGIISGDWIYSFELGIMMKVETINAGRLYGNMRYVSVATYTGTPPTTNSGEQLWGKDTAIFSTDGNIYVCTDVTSAMGTNTYTYQTYETVTSTEKQTWNDKADTTTISTDTTSTTVSLTLADNHEYRYTQDLTSLTLTMPSGDFIASVVFSSGSTPTSMTYDSSIKWSGDDVTSNAFVPSASKTYNVVFWYDGININAISRSA